MSDVQNQTDTTPPQADLRPPDTVMRLARMGAFFPTRLSFMRSLIRQLADEGAEVDRREWAIDSQGFGHAVYTVPLGGHAYSLVAFSTPLDPADRTDRVIAEAWDTSYVLFDGVPDTADIERLKANAPRQEAGRFEASDLVLSRANKSVRLFEHVVDSLVQGRQPDRDMIGSIGYLMRTTAVYGNGKFGIADRDRIASRPCLSDPFRAEMLTVWLIRGFTHDLVEHVARSRSPQDAVELDRDLKRFLGIGNATGLGMAPFLVTHPVLLNNWMMARETALARVRAIEHADAETVSRVGALFDRARKHLHQWNVDDHRQMDRIVTLRGEMQEFEALVTHDALAAAYPWDRLIAATAGLSIECQEFAVALVLEPHGKLVDALTHCMDSTVEPVLEPAMTIADLRRLIGRAYGWATDVDFDSRAANQRFWYVSEEKLEPRLGERFEEPGAELELPLDVARQVCRLTSDLEGWTGDQSVAAFLMRHPGHRQVVRRIQTSRRHPYAEIRDNLIGEECLPIDMLRCKLSFFGASKFDPKSDRWTRITLYQGAPLLDELDGADPDDWWLPVLESDQ